MGLSRPRGCAIPARDEISGAPSASGRLPRLSITYRLSLLIARVTVKDYERERRIWSVLLEFATLKSSRHHLKLAMATRLLHAAPDLGAIRASNTRSLATIRWNRRVRSKI